MSEEKEQTQDRIEVMMPLEAITGKYSNYLRISHMPTEFILDFCMLEGTHAHSVSRIIISSINIKNFVTAIKENMARYESNFNIELPENIDDFVQRGAAKKG